MGVIQYNTVQCNAIQYDTMRFVRQNHSKSHHTTPPRMCRVVPYVASDETHIDRRVLSMPFYSGHHLSGNAARVPSGSVSTATGPRASGSGSTATPDPSRRAGCLSHYRPPLSAGQAASLAMQLATHHGLIEPPAPGGTMDTTVHNRCDRSGSLPPSKGAARPRPHCLGLGSVRPSLRPATPTWISGADVRKSPVCTTWAVMVL